MPISSNYFVRPRQHIRRNRQADLLGGFQIDDKLEFRRLLHREIGGLSAFKDLVHIGSGAPVQVGIAHAVAHEPPGFHNSGLSYIAGSRFFTASSATGFADGGDGAPQHEDARHAP